MYEQRSRRVMFKYKFDKQLIERKLSRIKVIQALSGLQDVLMIKCVLKRIKLRKKLFVRESECKRVQGRQSHVGISFEVSCEAIVIEVLLHSQ